jgi:hypothetical protein
MFPVGLANPYPRIGAAVVELYPKPNSPNPLLMWLSFINPVGKSRFVFPNPNEKILLALMWLDGGDFGS